MAPADILSMITKHLVQGATSLMAAALCALAFNTTAAHPQAISLEPKTGKIGTLLKITGKGLDRAQVDEVYLTDRHYDYRLKVTEQNDQQIIGRVPQFIKPGRLQLVLHVTGPQGGYEDQPVWIQIEKGEETVAPPPATSEITRATPAPAPAPATIPAAAPAPVVQTAHLVAATSALPPPAPEPVATPVAVAPAPAPVPTPASPSFGPPSPAPTLKQPVAVESPVILRLAGSNTIGAKLAVNLAEAYLRSEGVANIRVRQLDHEDFRVEGDGRSIEIEAKGSATAFSGLATGKADIGMASRRITAEEAKSLATMGDLMGPNSEHVIALDGLAIIVNRANPVSALSKDDVARIFRGEVTDWKQVRPDALAGAIKIYARDDKSGTYDTFKSLVLSGKPLVKGAVRFEDSRELSEAVSSDPNGIGFIGLPYILNSKPLAISDKGTLPLQPTALTVSTEDYTLSRRLFLYTAAVSKNVNVGRFVAFALSRKGQDIVGETGFVSQNVRALPVTVDPGAASPEYLKVTRDAERLSLDFRFRLGSAGVDNKGLVDLDRLIQFVSSGNYTGKDIFLLGFADSTGLPAANYKLSQDRAKAVSDELRQRGLNAGVIRGFGPEQPIATNFTEDGREKNRRVEVWVRKRQ